MSTEGHNCWEDCDEGPHGCVCGNDCAPPRWMTEQDEREALAQRYCPVHGDLLAGTRSPRCSEAPKGHEFLHRQGQITEAVVEASARAIYAQPSVHGHIEDWDDDSEKVRNSCRAEARAALEAALNAKEDS